MCDQQRLRPACAYAQSDESLCFSLKYSMSVKLLLHHLELLSFKGGCTGSPVSTLVKTRLCWKSHVTAQMLINNQKFNSPDPFLYPLTINRSGNFLSTQSFTLSIFTSLNHMFIKYSFNQKTFAKLIIAF